MERSNGSVGEGGVGEGDFFFVSFFFNIRSRLTICFSLRLSAFSFSLRSTSFCLISFSFNSSCFFDVLWNSSAAVARCSCRNLRVCCTLM